MMLYKYKNLKYIFSWVVIYGLTVYIKSDKYFDMDSIVIASILTILILVFDMIFANNNMDTLYNALPQLLKNASMTTATPQTNNTCTMPEEYPPENTAYKNILKYVGSIINNPKTSQESWHDKYNLVNNDDISLSDILDTNNNIDNLDLDRHPPPQYKSGTNEEGYSIIPPKDWYQTQSAFYTKNRTRCDIQPIYIDSTTLDLKDWNASLISPNVQNTQQIINHVKLRYNT